jgi:hypothetical protein
LADVVGGQRAVFGIDEQPVIPAGLGEHGGRGAAEMVHAEAERETVADACERVMSKQLHSCLSKSGSYSRK